MAPQNPLCVNHLFVTDRSRRRGPHGINGVSETRAGFATGHESVRKRHLPQEIGRRIRLRVSGVCLRRTGGGSGGGAREEQGSHIGGGAVGGAAGGPRRPTPPPAPTS